MRKGDLVTAISAHQRGHLGSRLRPRAADQPSAHRSSASPATTATGRRGAGSTAGGDLTTGRRAGQPHPPDRNRRASSDGTVGSPPTARPRPATPPATAAPAKPLPRPRPRRASRPTARPARSAAAAAATGDRGAGQQRRSRDKTDDQQDTAERPASRTRRSDGQDGAAQRSSGRGEGQSRPPRPRPHPRRRDETDRGNRDTRDNAGITATIVRTTAEAPAAARNAPQRPRRAARMTPRHPLPRPQRAPPRPRPAVRTSTTPRSREDDVLLPVAGILDVLENYAFIRTSGYLPGPNDVYVSLAQVKKYNLRKGDAVVGAIRAPRDGEDRSQQTARQKFNALVRVTSVNGKTAGRHSRTASNSPSWSRCTPPSACASRRTRRRSAPASSTSWPRSARASAA